MSDDHGHDDWFRHSSSEAVQLSHGEFNGFGIAGFLIAVIVIVFAIVVVFVGWLDRSVAAQDRIMGQGRTEILAGPYNEAVATWESALNGDPVWLDQDTVRLPLDSATDQVVRMYAAQ